MELFKKFPVGRKIYDFTVTGYIESSKENNYQSRIVVICVCGQSSTISPYTIFPERCAKCSRKDIVRRRGNAEALMLARKQAIKEVPIRIEKKFEW
jgi:hypothetical protein